VTTPTNRYPPAVNALAAAFTAALPAPPAPDGVEVRLGVHLHPAYAARAVTVAMTFDEALNSVSVDRTETGAGRRVTESIDVACSLFVGGEGGAPDFDGWRAAAGDLLQVLDDAMRDDQALNDVVARTHRTFTRWIDWFDESGGAMGVIVDFIANLVVMP